MAMDSSSSRQEIGSLESMLIPTKAQAEKKPKPSEQALKCPRCDSTNTKFCYYNNYSLSQPRYFCKSCRRYWTKGGTLRNVPVGGGCRKTKRSSSSSSSSKRNTIDNQPRNPSPSIPSYSPNLSYDSNVFMSGLDDSGFPMSRNPSMLVSTGFLETPLGFQNLYYGIGDGINLGLETDEGTGTGMGMGMGMGIGIGLNQEMGLMGFEEMGGATTAVKQEIGRESGGLWGFPWQNVGGDGNIGSWNGIGSSNWQGLLNSPLM